MTHGREKSDPATVARKPTNKAVATAAEPVERRAGTEGNASQQSTLRAQDRDGVSQALERVRQAGNGRRRGSPGSSTTSVSPRFSWRSSRLNAMPPPAWTD